MGSVCTPWPLWELVITGQRLLKIPGRRRRYDGWAESGICVLSWKSRDWWLHALILEGQGDRATVSSSSVSFFIPYDNHPNTNQGALGGHWKQVTATASPGLRARIQTHTICPQRFMTLIHFRWHTLFKRECQPPPKAAFPHGFSQQHWAFVSWIIFSSPGFKFLSTASLPFSERIPSLLFILIWHLGSPEFLCRLTHFVTRFSNFLAELQLPVQLIE